MSDWVKVSDRLPRPNLDVLVCDTDDDVYVAYHENGTWYSSPGAVHLGHVIGWKHLPAPADWPVEEIAKDLEACR
jgi:hypothetical protein